MKTKGKFSIGKVIAFLLALSMIMTSLTVTTIGEDWTNVSGLGAMQKEISAGGTFFFKLSAATRYDSTTGSLKIPANADVHIDINGQRFYTNSKSQTHIINEGKLYITNSDKNGLAKGEIVNNSNDTYPVIDNKGELSIENTLIAQGVAGKETGGKGPNSSGGSADTSGIGVIRNASTGKLTLSNVAACGKIVNNGGTITPLENGYFFDNVETKGFVKTGFEAVKDTTFAACGYKVVKKDTPVETPVAWVTVDNTTTPYTDIALAKAAAQSAIGTVTYEVADAGTEDPLTWRDDLKASVEYSAGMIYSNDLLKAISKAAEVTNDGTADNRKQASINVLADCTIDSRMNIYSSAYNEEVYRLINFELNGHTITYSAEVSHLFYLGRYAYMNIYDSSEDHTGKIEAGAGLQYNKLFYTGGWSANTQKYTIYGGTFTGGAIISGNSTTDYISKNWTDIKGGSFSANPAGLLDDGYYAEPDDPSNPTLWTVKKEEPRKNEITVTANGITNSYTSFQAAWNAANVAGQTATIKLDIDEATCPSNLSTAASKIILDLNGCKLEDVASEEYRLLQVNGNTEFVLRDSKGTGSLVTNSSAGKNGAIIVRDNGKFTFESGTFKCASPDGLSVVDGIVAYDTDSVVEIKDGVVDDACLTNAAVGTWKGTIISEKAIAGGVYKKYENEGSLKTELYKATVSDEGAEYQVYYDTFLNAKKVAVARTSGDGGQATLKMLANFTTTKRQLFYDAWDEETTREITLDLNGYTFKNNGTGEDKPTSGLIAINKAGKITIDDTSEGKTGKIEAPAGTGYFLHSARYTAYVPNFIVNGGTFVGAFPLCNATTEGSIGAIVNGGTFDADPTIFVDTSEHQVIENQSDNTFTVKWREFIVTITANKKTTKYLKIVNAVNAILKDPSKEGTMVAFQDIALNDTLNLDDTDAKITLDLDGKTLSPAASKAFANIKSGALTIKNGTLDFTGNGNAAIKVANGAVLLFENVTLKGASTYVKSSGVVIVDGVVKTDGIVEQDASAAAIYEAQATVADDVKFTFVVSVATLGEDAGKDVTLTYTVDDMIDGEPSRKTITLTPESISGYNYTFKFEKGIPQWSVNSDLELKVSIEGKEVTSLSYTLQDYYNTLYYNNTDNNPLCALLANSIYWADALQKYIYGASTVDFGGWEEEYKSAAAPQASENKKAVKVRAASSDEKILSANVNVYDRSKLLFTLNAKAGDTVKVMMEGNNDPVYEKTFESDVTDFIIDLEDRLAPTQYDLLFTVTLSNGGGKLSEITYSMNSYAYAKQADETVLALYRYGHTASSYIEETDPDREHHYGEITYEWAKFYKTCTATRECTDKGCSHTETETATATRTTLEEGTPGIKGESYTMKAKFNNTAFKSQVHECVPDPQVPITKDTPDPIYEPEKHLILNSDGSYGGGTGAPKNGALDNLKKGYYVANDYYNLKCTSTRTLLPEFSPYQMTDKYGDAVSCVKMIMNYDGVTKSEEELIARYRVVNGSKTLTDESGWQGGSSEHIAKFLRDQGYTDAKEDCYDGSGLTNFIKKNLKAGKVILIRYQTSFSSHWRLIIGIDDMGTTGTTKDDVVIMANPYDAYDHYQDGYSVECVEIVNSWWKKVTRDLKTSQENTCVVVSLKNKPSFTVSDDDPVLANPSVPQRHLYLNTDGTFGGILDYKKYGDIEDVNGYSYKVTKNSDGSISLHDFYQQEHFNYRYFAYPDYYNMSSNTSAGRYILKGFGTFQQSMASSCGISSCLNTLLYYGETFKNVADKISDWGKKDAVFDLTNIGKEDYDKMQEACTRIYMDHDSYFGKDKTTRFNNYGGVGVSKLKNIPKYLGYTDGLSYANYTSGSGMSYSSFVDLIKTNVKAGRPTVVSWRPVHGHYETIIGYDSMGTSDTTDDVIILGDSHDVRDHYQDGYNTYPAEAFYARYFNGSFSLGQARLYFNDK